MNEKPNTGGPAFPVSLGMQPGWSGMSLRDYFAGLAMQGLIIEIPQPINDGLARLAYSIADAMLKNGTMKTKPSILLLLLACSCSTPRGFQCAVANFDQVDAQVYRSAQPNSIGVEVLARSGIKSVLNLRSNPWYYERTLCESNGMAYASVPLPALVAPSFEQLQSAMRALEHLPKPVLVHCAVGCDRTGLVIACYRVKCGWTVEAAWNEAKMFGTRMFIGSKTMLKRYEKRN